MPFQPAMPRTSVRASRQDRQRRALAHGRSVHVRCHIGRRSGGRQTQRPAPLVEYIQHVRFTEIDPYRPPARTLAVIALEVPIDAAERHLERHSFRGPAGDKLEGRSDNADQVSVVLPAQVGFDLPAVIRDY